MTDPFPFPGALSASSEPDPFPMGDADAGGDAASDDPFTFGDGADDLIGLVHEDDHDPIDDGHHGDGVSEKSWRRCSATTPAKRRPRAR